MHNILYIIYVLKIENVLLNVICWLCLFAMGPIIIFKIIFFLVALAFDNYCRFFFHIFYIQYKCL